MYNSTSMSGDTTWAIFFGYSWDSCFTGLPLEQAEKRRFSAVKRPAVHATNNTIGAKYVNLIWFSGGGKQNLAPDLNCAA